MTFNEALSNLKLNQPPPTGHETYQHLFSVGEEKRMCAFTDSSRWYGTKDVVPTLKALQKMVDFHYNEGIDMVKLGCTLPSPANICLHKSTTAKFYPFTESDKDLLEKILEDMVNGSFIVFTRKAVVDETLNRNSTNWCKTIVGIDAIQLHPYSMCQVMPDGLYTRWDLESESFKFEPRRNETRIFGHIFMSYFRSQTAM